ncbi:DNA-binding XRE family transcriptional regulator [Parvibaculum indicum]|uniref:helix-turn-helix domain-containing protein n=1 Tax=Parvibaculum indicum TaxID=562969 RepID=UPI00141D929F|nr:helix-turn-helix transcriptional regulator [Parvibaculum indicum]NIJ41099.1 DNA-binding XRE family transcriptional regulator [Parvibaculum indicum]
MSRKKDTKAGKRRIGNPAKRSSLVPLIEKIERNDITRNKKPSISAAAFRAGSIVRTMRKSSNLTQKELAERLDLTQSRISEIEAGMGTQGPTWDLMERIAAACESRILISPHATDFAIDATEFPDTATHWTVAAAES